MVPNRRRRLSLRGKLVAGFGTVLMLMLMVALAGYAIWAMADLNRRADTIGQEDVPALISLSHLQKNTVYYRMSQHERLFATDAAGVADYEGEQQSLAAEIAATFQAYRPAILNAADQARWQAAQQRWRAYVQASDPYLGLVRAGDTIGASVVLASADEQFTPVQDAIDAWLAGRQHATQQSIVAATTTYHSGRILTVALVLSAAAIAAAIGLLLARSIVTGVGRLIIVAEAIAIGDIDQDPDVRNQDEIGRLAAAFHQMIVYLRGAADTASRIAAGDLTTTRKANGPQDALGTALATMTTNLRGVVNDLAEAATTTASASQQLAAASQQAGRSVRAIATSASDLSHSAEQQRGLIVDARTSSNAARDIAAAGRATADRMRHVMTDLDEKSGRISGIVNAITRIADQTNSSL